MSPVWKRQEVGVFLRSYTSAIILSLFLSFLVAILFYIFSDYIFPYLTEDTKAKGVFGVFVLALGPFSVIWLHGAALKSLLMPAWANMVESFWLPFLMIVFIFVLYLDGSFGALEAARLYLVASLVIACLGFFAIFVKMKFHERISEYSKNRKEYRLNKKFGVLCKSDPV